MSDKAPPEAVTFFNPAFRTARDWLRNAWRQPILRLADTAIAVAVGIVAACGSSAGSFIRQKIQMVARAAGCVHKPAATGP